MFLDFSDLRVLLFGILVTAVVLTISVMKKKSVFAGIMLFIFVALLLLHTVTMCSKTSVIVDLIGVGVCISTYLIVDEIEIRRKKINQVFEDRYKD